MTSRQPDSLEITILARIRELGRGSVFVPGDFLELGSRTGVDFVPHRLVKQGNLPLSAPGDAREVDVCLAWKVPLSSFVQTMSL